MVNKNAFTMAEILVVMAIICIVAAFGVPSFTKAVTRARARDAINNLTIIKAAQQIYKSNNGGFLRADTLPGINSVLQLSITASGGADYFCKVALVPTVCTANSTGAAGDFLVTVTLADDSAPVCTTASNCCP